VTSTHSIARAGFAYPGHQMRNRRRRSTALAQLIASAALIVSIAVVATTFGMARPEVAPAFAASPSELPASGHQAVSKRPNSTSRPGAASNSARV
jgi:hypothetical protein